MVPLLEEWTRKPLYFYKAYRALAQIVNRITPLLHLLWHKSSHLYLTVAQIIFFIPPSNFQVCEPCSVPPEHDPPFLCLPFLRHLALRLHHWYGWAFSPLFLFLPLLFVLWVTLHFVLPYRWLSRSYGVSSCQSCSQTWSATRCFFERIGWHC